MDWSAFRALALEAGFARAWSVSVGPFARWANVTRADPDPRWAGLRADPAEILPEAKCLIVLAWAYAPYLPPRSGEPSVDAYYVASNAAHAAAERLAALLRGEGFRVDAAPSLPAKPALLRAGEALYGGNGLMAIAGLGTRVCVQMLLTDAPFPAEESAPEREIDPKCERCGACVAACPVKALNGDSRVRTDRCLRAISYADIMPEDARARIGGCLIGCDICQRRCPRNEGIRPVPMPEGLAEALRLERLLAGDVRELAGWIGANYARPTRVMGRAAILAANLNRRDCAPLLRQIARNDFEYVRAHASWALGRLGCE